MNQILTNPNATPCVHCRYHHLKEDMVHHPQLKQFTCPQCTTMVLELIKKTPTGTKIQPIKTEDIKINTQNGHKHRLASRRNKHT